MKRNVVLGVIIVAFAALLVTIPSQAFDIGQFQDELDAMQAEIEANGYTFTVGPNPAMQYDLEQLCSLQPYLTLPTMHLTQALGNISESVAGLPSSYTGYYTSIKDQWSCGACWAFAAVGLLESMILKKDGGMVDLSEQHMISCNPWGWGCDGGYWPNDMLVDQGAAMESCFPYVATEVACESCPTPYRIQSWGFVTGDNVVPDTTLIKQAIYTYGAVQVGVYVDTWFQLYTGGVFDRCSEGIRWTNHAVILCGWDDAREAWLLKNCWGTGWGESGFMWIKYGCNRVGDGANYFIY